MRQISLTTLNETNLFYTDFNFKIKSNHTKLLREKEVRNNLIITKRCLSVN